MGRGLYRDIGLLVPCESGETWCWDVRPKVKNGRAPFPTGSDTDWHGISRFSFSCARLGLVEPRFMTPFNRICAGKLKFKSYDIYNRISKVQIDPVTSVLCFFRIITEELDSETRLKADV